MHFNSLPVENFDNRLPSHVVRVGKYKGMRYPISMKCDKHGKYVAVTAVCAIRPLGGCPECSRQHSRTANPSKKHEDYVKEVARGTKDIIKVLGTYINSEEKIDHQCSCGRTWKVSPKSMLQNFGTCKQCVIERASVKGLMGLSKYHTKKIGNLDFRVQGHEGECIVFLYKRGFDLSKLKVHDGTLPFFKYKLKGKIRRYYPDFYYEPTRTIYEVKSTWSLGLKDRSTYYKNIKKAKAVTKRKYSFRMMVSGIHGIPPIILPECWINMRHSEMVRWMYECYGVTPSNSRGKIGK